MAAVINSQISTPAYSYVKSTSPNKIVLLENGWIVSAIFEKTYSTVNGKINLFISKDEGTSWSILSSIDTIEFDISEHFSITSNGNIIYYYGLGFKINAVQNFQASSLFARIDVVNQTSMAIKPEAHVNSQRDIYSGSTSVYVNDSNTEIHVCWSIKYDRAPESYNLRYSKGVISPQGQVTWGSTEDITLVDSQASSVVSPTVFLNEDQVPVIVTRYEEYYQTSIVSYVKTGGTWNKYNVLAYPGHHQSVPHAIFVPKRVNGLNKGRIWVTWSGRDSNEQSGYNVRVSYSDDGGITWASHTKLTSGNSYNQETPLLTADRTNNVFIVWNQNTSSGKSTARKAFKTSWGSTITYDGAYAGANHYDVSVIFDSKFKTRFIEPPIVRMAVTNNFIYYSGSYTYGPTISPTASKLGNKLSSSVINYSVSPDPGSTISKVEEFVNGQLTKTYTNPSNLNLTSIIPLNTWSSLDYFSEQHLEIVVSDSLGMESRKTYKFGKGLSSPASLSEVSKAVAHGKNRIESKRLEISTALGLPEESTFDDLSDFIGRGMLGMSWRTSGNIDIQFPLRVTNLPFTPSFVMVTYTYVVSSIRRASFVVLTNNKGIYRPDGLETDAMEGIHFSNSGSGSWGNHSFQHSPERGIIRENEFEITLKQSSDGTNSAIASYKVIAIA